MVTQVVKRPQRWTAERQTEVVLAILRGETSVDDVARDFGFGARRRRCWRERFLEGGARALRGEEEPAPSARHGPRQARLRGRGRAVGRTPLVRLNAVVAGFTGQAYAKLEHMNPMGSVKDRLGRHLVERAAADGASRPAARWSRPRPATRPWAWA